MADNSTLDVGAGGDTIRTKDRTSAKTQIVGLDLTPAGGSETLMNGSIPVTDNSGSLTVDAPVGTPVFVRLSDGSSAIATLPVSVAALPGQAADGAAALPATLYVVAGWDGTNIQALATDSSGLLQVDVATIAAGDNNIGNVDLASAIPAGNNNIGDVDIASIAAGDNNIGNVDVVTLPAIPAGTNNIGDVDVLTLPSIPAGNNNIGDVDIASALPAGTNAIGKLAANSGVDIGDVDVTSISAGTNAIGNVGIIPRTTGGYTTFHLVSAGSTNATSVKGSAGQLFGWYIYNSNAAARKVAFHNTAGTPTAGSSVFFSLMVPPTSAANVFTDAGIAFSTGIGITTVTGLADSDSAAVAANDLIINLWYA